MPGLEKIEAELHETKTHVLSKEDTHKFKWDGTCWMYKNHKVRSRRLIAKLIKDSDRTIFVDVTLPFRERLIW